MRLILTAFVAIFVCSNSVSVYAGPLKVFILAGQSNMQGHAQVRTFEHIGMNPETAAMLQDMQNEDGSPRICQDVWISSIGSADTEQTGQLTAGFGAAAKGPKIGPEFTFGIYMHKALDEPILIIKTAWGGKSLHTDFRSPGAGPSEFSEQQLERFRSQKKDIAKLRSERVAATGVYYRLMIEHVKSVLDDIKRVYPGYDSAQGYELAGFVWFQGWNDMVDSGVYPNRDQPGGYDQYNTVLAHFIRDVRKDLSAAKLPFVIGVLGVGGPVDKYLPDQKRYAGVHQNFRDAMAAPASLPEFKGNVKLVLTENYWDEELTALRARDNKINQRVKQLQKDGQLTREQLNSKKEELRAKEFSEQERKVLEVGVSNLEFHYLGSAKIMAGIGKGFAEALIVP